MKRVGSGLRSQIGPPSPPWDPRLPEIGTGARTSQYASNTVRISDVPACVVFTPLDFGSWVPLLRTKPGANDVKPHYVSSAFRYFRRERGRGPGLANPPHICAGLHFDNSVRHCADAGGLRARQGRGLLLHQQCCMQHPSRATLRPPPYPTAIIDIWTRFSGDLGDPPCDRANLTSLT